MADALRCDNSNQEPWLLKAFSQNRHVKEKIADCARELSLANRALKENLNAIDGVRKAVAWNEQMEVKFQQCADAVQLVHAFLAKEMAELNTLDQQLYDSQKQAEEHRYLAFHDDLTGLANRALFNDRLGQALLLSQRHRRLLSVLFIDINNFKLIKDTYGHDIGDRVLQVVAAQLQACVRQEDTVARMGGDEFMCLIMEVKEDAAIAEMATSMIERISEACGTIAAQLVVRPSIGIAMCPQDGTTSKSLLKSADVAMYKAKANGTGYGLFNPLLHCTG